MSKLIEQEIVILAAGQQTRYDSMESKLMARIDSVPLIRHTLSSILSVIPEEYLRIITSHAFQDFNDYVLRQYPKSEVIFDDKPGHGTAQSLKLSFPWREKKSLVTEANIFYRSTLLRNLLDRFSIGEPIAILAVTPKTEVAETHRMVKLQDDNPNFLDLNTKGCSASAARLRNVGVYAISSRMFELIGETPDIIEVLNLANMMGHPVAAVKYLHEYCHTATIEDIKSWQKMIAEGKIKDNES